MHPSTTQCIIPTSIPGITNSDYSIQVAYVLLRDQIAKRILYSYMSVLSLRKEGDKDQTVDL